MLPAGSVNQAMSGPVPGPCARDALLVLVGVLVALEVHTGGGELVDRRVDVGHLEVEHREGRRLVVVFRVDEDVRRAEVELDAHAGVARVEAEGVAIEGERGREVVHRESAESAGGREHERLRKSLRTHEFHVYTVHNATPVSGRPPGGGTREHRTTHDLSPRRPPAGAPRRRHRHGSRRRSGCRGASRGDAAHRGVPQRRLPSLRRPRRARRGGERRGIRRVRRRDRSRVGRGAAADPRPRPRTRTCAPSVAATCASRATSPACSAPHTRSRPTSSRRSAPPRRGRADAPRSSCSASRSTSWWRPA